MKYRKWLGQLVVMVALTGSTAALAGGLVAVPEQPQADDFTLPAADGSHHQLLDYRGRYVLVNFWAAWCSPCIRELPSMQHTYLAMKDREFEILAVHVGPKTPDMQSLLEGFGISFPVLVDAELILGNWNVTGLPSSFLLDPEGRVIYQATGAIDWDEPAQRKLLGQLLNGRINAVANETVPAAIL